jgi:hypothetical protein
LELPIQAVQVDEVSDGDDFVVAIVLASVVDEYELVRHFEIFQHGSEAPPQDWQDVALLCTGMTTETDRIPAR